MAYLTPKDLKVLFIGTPKIAATVLEALIQASFDVVACITQEDKPKGRKGVLTYSEAKETALKHGIPVYQPRRIRKEHGFLKDLNYDIIVCIAYGQILPKEVLDSAPLGAYNLHASVLPKYRGAAPIQRALWNGEVQTGVTLMKMGEGMDDGDIYDILHMIIWPSDNYTSLSEKIAEAASTLITSDLLPLSNGRIEGHKQDHEEMTLAPKISPEDERLSLLDGLNPFHNRVRALSYEPGGYLYLNGKKLKILKTEPHSDETGLPIGTLFADRRSLYLSLKDGVLEILELQLEGGKRMDARSFLNGHPSISGSLLSEEPDA